MNIPDVIWLLSIGAALFALLIECYVFFSQEGRARIYFGGLLVSVVILALVSLVTGMYAKAEIETWFKVSRSVAWVIVAFFCMRLLLFQLGKLNGVKK